MDQKAHRVTTKVRERVDRAAYWIQFGKTNEVKVSYGPIESIKHEMRRSPLVEGVTFLYQLISLLLGFLVFGFFLLAVLPASILSNAEGVRFQMVAVTCLAVWISLPWFVHTYQFSTRKGKLDRDGVLKVFLFDIFYLFGLGTALLLLWAFDAGDPFTANVVSSLGPFVFAGPFLLIVFDAYARVPAGMSREAHELLRKQLSDKYDEVLEIIASQHTVDEWKKRNKRAFRWMLAVTLICLMVVGVAVRASVSNLGMLIVVVPGGVMLALLLERLGSTKQILRILESQSDVSRGEVSN